MNLQLHLELFSFLSNTYKAEVFIVAFTGNYFNCRLTRPSASKVLQGWKLPYGRLPQWTFTDFTPSQSTVWETSKGKNFLKVTSDIVSNLAYETFKQLPAIPPKIGRFWRTYP